MIGAPDTAAVSEFLRIQTGAVSVDPGDFLRLAGGAIQHNFSIEFDVVGGALDGQHALVLRTDAESGVRASRTRVEEYELLQLAFDHGVRVPEPIAVCDDPAVIGKPFFLMRRLPGISNGRDVVQLPLTASDRERLLAALGAELAKIHNIAVENVELPFLNRPGDPPAASRIRQYREYLDAFDRPQPVIEWALEWLHRHMPSPGPVVLCHGDFRTGNYLVDRGTVAGILDWEFADLSDPLEDVGWLCARCWRFGQWDREAGGIGDRAAFYQGYESSGGRRLARTDVRYWEVMAAVRWSVIALQQAQRFRKGGESALELALTEHLVPQLELDMLQTVELAEYA